MIVVTTHVCEPHWRPNAFGISCDVGPLHLGLFRDEGTRWSVFVYFREGIEIAGALGKRPRLAVLHVDAETEEVARTSAVRVALQWLVSEYTPGVNA